VNLTVVGATRLKRLMINLQTMDHILRRLNEMI